MMHPKWSCYRMGFQIESRPRPMSIGIKPRSHGWPNRPNYVQQEVQVSETCNIIKRKNQLWIIISFGIFLISYFSLFPLSIFLILAFLFYLGNACVSFIENWLCGLPIFQGKKKILNPPSNLLSAESRKNARHFTLFLVEKRLHQTWKKQDRGKASRFSAAFLRKSNYRRDLRVQVHWMFFRMIGNFLLWTSNAPISGHLMCIFEITFNNIHIFSSLWDKTL